MTATTITRIAISDKRQWKNRDVVSKTPAISNMINSKSVKLKAKVFVISPEKLILSLYPPEKPSNLSQSLLFN
ncbi:CLUMA_CG008362, isoform A [Clunio marinus]|uniref:CLUMA_CG008362, isoform A n=1 Tax=Clunio marinus TaxID=568069 RepID=A0A1J1I7E1_9DIPT|nr:CLUMA_CG008362, isoform A [Clunio marinus]